MAFPARFDGTCFACNKPIISREHFITWSRKHRGRAYHYDCDNPTRVPDDYRTVKTVATETALPTTETSQTGQSNSNIAVQPSQPTNGNGHANLAESIAQAIADYLPEQDAHLDEETIRKMVQDEVLKIAFPTRVEVSNSQTGEVRDMGVQHAQFATLVKILAARQGMNVWMVGPAGSGKTTAAENAASALGLPFYFCGAQSNEYGLLGFIDASGKVVRTNFREAYENGGVFLFDEVDASAPAALLAFNAALANGLCAFPDAIVARHPDFVAIAAANTFGQGAGTNDYVGRLKQDAAFIDRFVFLKWKIDEELERATAGNTTWVDRVQALRRAVKAKGVKVIVSPRASYFGAKLLSMGLDQETVEELTIRKGMDDTTWESLQREN